MHRGSVWKELTASLQLANEAPGEPELSSRDKFNTARKALTALRNAEESELPRLQAIMPSLDIGGKKWSAHEERRLLAIV